MAKSASKPRIGFLGGSFDPVHKGHLQLAYAALKEQALSCVYFVLAPASPFKMGRTTTPASVRLAVLRKTIADEPRFKVALWELNRRGPAYTVQTLTDYKKKHPAHDLFFLMGSDAWASFPNWKNPGLIKKTATLLIGRRPGARLIPVSTQDAGQVKVLKGVFPNLSSTQVRLKKIEKKLKKLLSPFRFEHSLGVARLARELALVHGVNAEDAYLTGLVHDNAKEWKPRDLHRYVKENKLSVPNVNFISKTSPNLLHAYVSADQAQKKGWVTFQEGIKAIRAHTLGALNMGLFEKIIYVADYAAYGRPFSGAAAHRRLAKKNIDMAFKAAFQQKMAHALMKQKPLHPLTLLIWNRLTMGKKNDQ